MVANKKYNLFTKAKIMITRVIGYSKLRITLRMFSYNLSMFFTFAKFADIESDNIYDYHNNIIPKRKFRHESYYGNIMYGSDYTFKLFCSSKIRFNGYVEHGLYLGAAANEANFYRKNFKNVITFSKYRTEIIKKVNTNIGIIAIGPYINYAISKNDEFILNERCKNGKTLLVFPQHSTDNISVEFDINQMIENIERIKNKHDFKTILVCLYFKDIINGKDADYIKKGYTVVTSGYKEDPLFLARQKTFLLMCDGVLTNNIGTYVGYAVFYNKPVCYVPQKKRFIDVSGIEKNLGKSADEIVEEDRNLFLESLFLSDEMVLTKEQFDACSYYWGFDCIKDKQQFNEELYSAHKKIKHTNKTKTGGDNNDC